MRDNRINKNEIRKAKVFKSATSAAKFAIKLVKSAAYVRQADCQGSVRYIVHWVQGAEKLAR